LSASSSIAATAIHRRDSDIESSDMASGSDDKTMDTVPGGESTQYV